MHISKDTLFHYDKIGLLKPQIIKDNEYRLYLFYQYFDYDLIKGLQGANMSLTEIRDFMKERNNNNYIQILKEKYNDLENERKRIKSMQYRIKKAISLNEYGMNTQHMVPFIEECEEEHFIHHDYLEDYYYVKIQNNVKDSK